MGRQRQLEGELEEEDRADRQVGPGEEPVLPGREPRGRAALEHGFGRRSARRAPGSSTSTVFSRMPTNRGRRASPCGGPAASPATRGRPGVRGADDRACSQQPACPGRRLRRRLVQDGSIQLRPVRALGRLGASGATAVQRDAEAGRKVDLVREVGRQCSRRLELRPSAATRNEPAGRGRRRTSLRRSTARRRLMSSRKAVVSPTSSSAVCTMRSQGTTRADRSGSVASRSSATSASSPRRLIQLVDPLGRVARRCECGESGSAVRQARASLPAPAAASSEIDRPRALSALRLVLDGPTARA